MSKYVRENAEVQNLLLFQISSRSLEDSNLFHPQDPRYLFQVLQNFSTLFKSSNCFMEIKFSSDLLQESARFSNLCDFKASSNLPTLEIQITKISVLDPRFKGDQTSTPFFFWRLKIQIWFKIQISKRVLDPSRCGLSLFTSDNWTGFRKKSSAPSSKHLINTH